MGRYISNTNTSSYQDNELLLLKQGFAKNHKEFLTAGTDTWTIDHDVIVRVRVWGGGGGGGGGLYRSTGNTVTRVPGAGGGAGGTAEAILRLSAGTYNITVGGGGGAGKDSTGNATGGAKGGSSSFHTYITCSGGAGGTPGDGTIAIYGGKGGVASFNWSGFDGFLYAEGQPGGNGGSYGPGLYAVRDSSIGTGLGLLPFDFGPEKGDGESGGPRGLDRYPTGYHDRLHFFGGGGGGYNPPFIYGATEATASNAGRGVGAGGAGGGGSIGRPDITSGNSGAVVIEWN